MTALTYQQTELLIMEVQMRPELWDTSVEDYKNKVKKNAAWNEICEAVFSDFESNDEQTKRQMNLEMRSRWKSIRDSHTRTIKKNKRKSRCGDKPSKRYLYADQLEFLHTIPKQNRERPDVQGTFQDLSADECEDEHEEAAASRDGASSHWRQSSSSSAAAAGRESSSASFKNRGQKRVFEDAVISYMDLEDEDRDFFSSLLPSVKTLNEDQKLMFRAEVIRVLREIKAGRLSDTVYQNVFAPSSSSMPYNTAPSSDEGSSSCNNATSNGLGDSKSTMAK